MQLKTFLTSVAVTALVIPSVLANTSKVLAEDITILLENKTRANMTEFYASPSGVKNWENDILGDDVLRSGKVIEISMTSAQLVSMTFKPNLLMVM